MSGQWGKAPQCQTQWHRMSSKYEARIKRPTLPQTERCPTTPATPVLGPNQRPKQLYRIHPRKYQHGVPRNHGQIQQGSPGLQTVTPSRLPQERVKSTHSSTDPGPKQRYRMRPILSRRVEIQYARLGFTPWRLGESCHICTVRVGTNPVLLRHSSLMIEILEACGVNMLTKPQGCKPSRLPPPPC